MVDRKLSISVKLGIIFLLLTLLIVFTGCSGKEDLSRKKAEKIIYAEFMKGKPKLIQEYPDSNKNGQYQIMGTMTMMDSSVVANHRKLEQQGYLKIVTGQYGSLYAEFTDKAKPYIVKTMNTSGAPIIVATCAELDKIEVTGIAELADAGGKKIRVVNFNAHYKPTPFALLYKNDELNIKLDHPLTLFDDGWRAEDLADRLKWVQ